MDPRAKLRRDHASRRYRAVPIPHRREAQVRSNASDHVFEKSDFIPFVDQLQSTATKGTGCYAQRELTTVENKYWHIKAGRKVVVTLFYIGRTFAWERRLPAELRHALTVDTIPEPRPTAAGL